MRLASTSVVAVLTCGVALAQFQHLVTTDDGSRLFFSSNQRQRGGNQFPYWKIFAWEAGDFRLIAQSDLQTFFAFDRVWTNFFQLLEPDVSGDGSVLAWGAWRSCSPSRSCSSNRWETTVLGAPGRGEWRISGRAWISANARYLLSVGGPDLENRGVFLWDLATGVRRRLEVEFELGVPGTSRRPLTSNGTALLVGAGSQLTMIGPGGSRQFRSTEPPASVEIDDAATTVVYETWPWPARRLRVLDLATGTDRLLRPQARETFGASLSRVGSMVFISRENWTELPQVFLARLDGSGLRQLAADPDGIAEATLSGNGQIVYYVTATGRLVRMEVATGQPLSLAGPALAFQGGGVVPGSLAVLRGQGLADKEVSAEPPLPLSLGGVRVRVGGVPAPLLLVSPKEIRFQTPWEVSEGTVELELAGGLNAPFEPAEGLRWRPGGQPAFLSLAHSRSGDPVTASAPAQPGEVIHAYMTGLGPVAPPIATGLAAPIERPPEIVKPVACRVQEFEIQGGETKPGRLLWAEIWSAQLAPGQVGVYRVGIRLPSDLKGGEPALWPEFDCGLGGPAARARFPLARSAPPRTRR